MPFWRRGNSSDAEPTSTSRAPRGSRGAADFADSVEEARRRFDLYKSDDPFPEIPSALLNSADIADYVRATGMIYPFDADASSMKPASYSVPLLGEVVYWDDSRVMQVEDVRLGDKFTLKQNSIAFVTMEPEFRLPDYIAIRFNLKIPNVYKGLLLGTGPLVDPGWEGRLSIPLHNLTTNDYEFEGGEGLIWMEFTKLSPNERWAKRKAAVETRSGEYIPFPEDKKFGRVQDRLASAARNMPVSSSLAEAVTNAKSAAKDARSLSTRIQIGGIIALVFGLATIVALAVDVLFFERNHQGTTKTPVVVVNGAGVQSLDRQIRQLRSRINALERQVKPRSK
jgi:deoxycytidine triphosphate deaminase